MAKCTNCEHPSHVGDCPECHIEVGICTLSFSPQEQSATDGEVCGCGHAKRDHHNGVDFCCEIDEAAYFCEIKGCHCEDFSALPQTEQDGTLPDGHDTESSDDGPFCRDCADEDGICPNSNLPCDPYIAAWHQSELASLREKVEKYEEMFSKAQRAEIVYHPEVYITVYPHTRGSVLHYRDREGDWLNDPTVDTDFTGDRKWKRFDTALEAFEALKQEQG